jgi:hypothetical protein
MLRSAGPSITPDPLRGCPPSKIAQAPLEPPYTPGSQDYTLMALVILKISRKLPSNEYRK